MQPRRAEITRALNLTVPLRDPPETRNPAAANGGAKLMKIDTGEHTLETADMQGTRDGAA